MTTRPTPRPALRKAPDRDVHPAEPRGGVVPLREPAETPVAPPIERPAAPPAVRPALTPRRRSTDSSDGDRDLRLRRGSTTSDALRGAAGDKLVDVNVRIPKSLRKRLRQEAKRRGVSPDELVTLLLRDTLD